jgi:hypothetical protein
MATGRRPWKLWPSRTVQELNGVSGVATLGGIAIGAGGLTILTGAAALALTGAGALIVAGAFGYAVVRGMPPKFKLPQELVGQVVDIHELSNVSPSIPMLSIIGPAQAGKTTLRHRLSFDFSTPARTQQISAFVVSLQTSPPSFFAILDGGGEKLAQQFKIAQLCDCLCIVIDHNKSDSDPAIDVDRLSEHEEFLNQVKHYLDESKATPKLWTRFLINKHDLWSSAPPEERSKLENLCKGEVEKWQVGRRAERVDFCAHSNNATQDVAKFMNLLKLRSTLDTLTAF